MDWDQSGQRHGADLETSSVNVSQRVQSRASAGVRLARGAGRRGGGSHLSADIRDQLQGVLLAKPGRSQYLALPVRGQVDLRRRTGSEPASCRAGVRADRIGAVRLLYCKSGWKVHVLVPPAESARSNYRTVVRGSELPVLPFE